MCRNLDPLCLLLAELNYFGSDCYHSQKKPKNKAKKLIWNRSTWLRYRNGFVLRFVGWILISRSGECPNFMLFMWHSLTQHKEQTRHGGYIRKKEKTFETYGLKHVITFV